MCQNPRHKNQRQKYNWKIKAKLLEINLMLKTKILDEDRGFAESRLHCSSKPQRFSLDFRLIGTIFIFFTKCGGMGNYILDFINPCVRNQPT